MKLKLTENQYSLLLNYINETKFDVSMRSQVKVNDIISIEFNDNITNNFKVIENNNGGIIMDNIDVKSTNINYRYFFDLNSFNNNELDLRRVHKFKQADLADENPASWPFYTIKNIKRIRVFSSNGLKKDEVDIEPINKNKPKKEKYDKNFSTEVKTEIKDIFKKLSQLNENENLKFNLSDNSEINFCTVSQHGYTYELTINNIKGNRHKYEFLKDYRIVLSFNESAGQNEMDEIIKTKNNGQIKSLLLKLIKGEVEKRYYLDFINFELGGKCEDIIKNNIDKEKNKNTKEREESKEILNLVLNDPLLKKAFLSTPKLFGLIKLGEPKGIIPAEKLLNGYFEKRIKNQSGTDTDNFKSDRRGLLEFLYEPIDKLLGTEQFKINVGEHYIARVKNFSFKDKHIILISAKPRYKLYILNNIETDIFKATLEKDYMNINGIKEHFKKNVTIKVKDYDY